MGNFDSLTELANTLDIFFKGLSECNLLTTYSLQLQAMAVENEIEIKIKFHTLVHQCMKNLQGLLLKIPKVPGQEIGYDVATQTDEPVKLKIADIHVPSLVEFIWDGKDEPLEERKAPNFIHSTTDIIVTCDPESLPTISEHRFTDETAPETEIKLLIDDPINQEAYQPKLETEEKCESLMHVIESPADSDDTVSNASLFICETCEKTFSSARTLGQHLRMKHQTKGQCDMCTKKFASVQSLQEHCRSEHGGNGCFTCADCGRRFMTKLSYCRHVDTHNGKKGAVCDICGKSFSRADYLQKHYMTHTGTRPHSCFLCTKKFVSSSQLRVHERTHSGLRAHVCDMCSKAFSRIDKLKEHMMRHLSIKRFNCSLCHRTYAEKRDLTKHLKVHISSTT